jgi:hypothetical protein
MTSAPVHLGLPPAQEGEQCPVLQLSAYDLPLRPAAVLTFAAPAAYRARIRVAYTHRTRSGPGSTATHRPRRSASALGPVDADAHIGRTQRTRSHIPTTTSPVYAFSRSSSFVPTHHITPG